MKLALEHNLPFTTASLSFRGRPLEIPNILIDTGSASTVFATDAVTGLGITPALPTPVASDIGRCYSSDAEHRTRRISWPFFGDTADRNGAETTKSDVIR